MAFWDWRGFGLVFFHSTTIYSIKYKVSRHNKITHMHIVFLPEYWVVAVWQSGKVEIFPSDVRREVVQQVDVGLVAEEGPDPLRVVGGPDEDGAGTVFMPIKKSSEAQCFTGSRGFIAFMRITLSVSWMLPSWVKLKRIPIFYQRWFKQMKEAPLSNTVKGST